MSIVETVGETEAITMLLSKLGDVILEKLLEEFEIEHLSSENIRMFLKTYEKKKCSKGWFAKGLNMGEAIK